MDAHPRIDLLKLSLIPEPFDHPDWVFELKHYGFRALAYVAEAKCELISRRRNAYKSFDQLREPRAPFLANRIHSSQSDQFRASFALKLFSLPCYF
jgi:hypothetical protein